MRTIYSGIANIKITDKNPVALSVSGWPICQSQRKLVAMFTIPAYKPNIAANNILSLVIIKIFHIKISVSITNTEPCHVDRPNITSEGLPLILRIILGSVIRCPNLFLKALKRKNKFLVKVFAEQNLSFRNEAFKRIPVFLLAQVFFFQKRKSVR